VTRVLVTGGGGFIGSHLVDALLEAGHEVRVLDNFATGDRRNLLHVAGDVEIVEGDLRSFERTLRATRGCEVVFHQAALPSVPRSVQDPLTSSSVNVTGTLNVLLSARDTGARRVVFASSSSVYGGTPAEVKREDLPVAPLSPYGVSKYSGEAYCVSFANVYGLETVALRYFNVFGPRQSPISEYAAVIPAFFSSALLGEEPTIYGDGLQCRDFTYVENVVQANLLAAEADGVSGEVFNVGCGSRISVLQLLDAIAEIAAGEPIAARHAEARPGDVRVAIADISKAEERLGYTPAVDLAQGLARVHEYFLSNDTLLPQVHERRQWLAAVH